jgi:hypothetical protein
MRRQEVSEVLARKYAADRVNAYVKVAGRMQDGKLGNPVARKFGRHIGLQVGQPESKKSRGRK